MGFIRAPTEWCTKVEYYDIYSGEKLAIDKYTLKNEFEIIEKERFTSLKTIYLFYYVRRKSYTIFD